MARGRRRRRALPAATGALAAAASLAACASLVGVQEVQVDGVGGAGGAGGSGAAPASCAEAIGSACPVCSACELVSLEAGQARLFPGILSGSGQLSPAPAASCPDGAPGPERVYAVKFNAAQGFLTASLKRRLSTVSARPFDSVLYALTDCCDASTAVLCGDSSGDAGRLGGGEVISFPLTSLTDPQAPIFVVVDSAAGSEGDYELTLAHVDGAPCAASRIEVELEPGSPLVLQGNTQASGAPSAAGCARADGTSVGQGSEVVYELKAPYPAVQRITARVEATFDVVLHARATCGASPIACVDEGGVVAGERHADLPNDGGPLLLVVDSPLCAAGQVCGGDYTLTITPSP